MNNAPPIEPTQLVEQVLTLLPETQAIYLFGSHANGTANAQSDLDLAVLLPPPRAFTTEQRIWWQITEQLSDLANCHVDLINFYRASTVFQIQIVRTGQRIYCPDPQSCDEYEGLLLSLYQKLNEERAEIITAIRETGIIYG